MHGGLKGQRILSEASFLIIQNEIPIPDHLNCQLNQYLRKLSSLWTSQVESKVLTSAKVSSFGQLVPTIFNRYPLSGFVLIFILPFSILRFFNWITQKLLGGPKGANQELFIVQFHFVQVLSNSFLSKVGGGGEGAGSQLAPSFKQFHLSLNIPRENNLFSVHLSVALFWD